MKTREEMVDALVDDTLEKIKDDLSIGDASLLDAALRGRVAGFTPFGDLSDAAIQKLYTELGQSELGQSELALA